MRTHTEPIAITFTDAYEELKEITSQLNGADRIDPDELVELLSRGKGLERALRERLDQVEQQVKAIEGDKEFTAYRIVADAQKVPSDVPADDSDLLPSSPPPPAAGPAADDIPF
jgi:exodeoxyribonuclease VII small subunit